MLKKIQQDRQTGALDGCWGVCGGMKEVKGKTSILSELEMNRQTGLAEDNYLRTVAWGGMEIGSL